MSKQNTEIIHFTLDLFNVCTDQAVPEGTTVRDIVDRMHVLQFLVMLNKKHIPVSQYDQVVLQDGDVLKLLPTLLAGG